MAFVSETNKYNIYKIIKIKEKENNKILERMSESEDMFYLLSTYFLTQIKISFHKEIR